MVLPRCTCEPVVEDGITILKANPRCYFHGEDRTPDPDKPEKEPTPARDEFITTADLALEFDVTVGTVRKWVKEGKLNGTQVNGYWYVSLDDARAFAKERFNA